jgi:hypothetical protein
MIATSDQKLTGESHEQTYRLDNQAIRNVGCYAQRDGKNAGSPQPCGPDEQNQRMGPRVMPWYTTADAQRDAQKPGATDGPSLATVLRLARESGAWEPGSLPTDWDKKDLVFSPSQLFGFARLLAAEIRNKPR